MARCARVQHIKSYRSYTNQEAADCTGVTPQTVRRWVKGGLRIMASQRPFLILGADLKAFALGGRGGSCGKMPAGHFNCLSCKAKGPPALAIVEYRPISDKHGMLHGFCGKCEGPATLIVSRSVLPVSSPLKLCQYAGRERGISDGTETAFRRTTAYCCPLTSRSGSRN